MTEESVVCEVLYTYDAKGANEMSIQQGETLKLISRHGEWIFTEKKSGQRGMVPASYISETKPEPIAVPPPPPQATTQQVDIPPPPAAAAAVTTETKPKPTQQHSQSQLKTPNDGKMRAKAIKTVTGKGASHLTFNEGDIITIIEQFPTGWWRGELNGKYGLLPKGAVVLYNGPIETTQPQTVQQQHTRKVSASKQQQTQPKATVSAAQQPEQQPEQQQQNASGFKKKFMAKAQFPYSGTTENELSFSEGDEIIIYQDDIPGGWWLGELKGKIGHAPSGFLVKIEEPVAAATTTTATKQQKEQEKPIETKPIEPKQEEHVVEENALEESTNQTANEAPILGELIDPEKQLPNCPFNAIALYDYTAASESEVTLKEGEQFRVMAFAQLGWCTVDKAGKLGHVPRGWIKPIETTTTKEPTKQTESKPPEITATQAVAEKPKSDEGTKQKVKALYDFTPQGDGQLALKVGDIINIIAKANSMGWCQGELNGAIGFFPESFVEPISEQKPQQTATATTTAVPTTTAAESTTNTTTTTATSTTNANPPVVAAPTEKPPEKQEKPKPKNMPIVKAKVVHANKPKDKTQLTLAKGDIVTLLEMPVRDLWTGELNGTVGKFPGNCVKLLTPEEIKEREAKETKEKEKDKHSGSILSIFGHKKSTSITPSIAATTAEQPTKPAEKQQQPTKPSVVEKVPEPIPPPPTVEQPKKETDIPPPAATTTTIVAEQKSATNTTTTTSATNSAKGKRPMPIPPTRNQSQTTTTTTTTTTTKPKQEQTKAEEPIAPPAIVESPQKETKSVETNPIEQQQPNKEMQEKMNALEERLKQSEEENKKLKEQMIESEKQHAMETEQLWKQFVELQESVDAKAKEEEKKPRVSVEDFERVSKLASDLDKWMREEMTAQRNRETQMLKLQAAVDSLKTNPSTTTTTTTTPTANNNTQGIVDLTQ